MNTDKRILITGAAGYIGHQLGNRLAQDYFVMVPTSRTVAVLNSHWKYWMFAIRNWC